MICIIPKRKRYSSPDRRPNYTMVRVQGPKIQFVRASCFRSNLTLLVSSALLNVIEKTRCLPLQQSNELIYSPFHG